MPSKWAMVDNSFPTFRGDEKPAQQIAMLTDYMFILVEELKYQLANLDTENWNGTALKDFQTGTTADLTLQVSNMAVRLAAMAGELALLTGKVAALEGLWGQVQGMEDTLGELAETTELLWAADDELAAQLEKLEELPEKVAGLEEVLTRDANGGAIIGAEGLDLHLRGNVYINGKLFTEEGSV